MRTLKTRECIYPIYLSTQYATYKFKACYDNKGTWLAMKKISSPSVASVKSLTEGDLELSLNTSVNTVTHSPEVVVVMVTLSQLSVAMVTLSHCCAYHGNTVSV